MVNVAHHLCLYLHHMHTHPLLMRLMKSNSVFGLDGVGGLNCDIELFIALCLTAGLNYSASAALLV